MLLCYVIDSGLSTSLLLLATLIIMFYITLHLQTAQRFLRLIHLCITIFYHEVVAIKINHNTIQKNTFQYSMDFYQAY